jgi:hypothetical protein
MLRPLLAVRRLAPRKGELMFSYELHRIEADPTTGGTFTKTAG